MESVTRLRLPTHPRHPPSPGSPPPPILQPPYPAIPHPLPLPSHPLIHAIPDITVALKEVAQNPAVLAS